MIILTPRLKTAAELCRKGVTVCDVGTDHAYLACYLAKNGAKNVIACDINDGPLDSARRTVCDQKADNVTVLKSDGLKAIDFADDVVICGMGGELIADIIDGCRFLSSDTRFIVQPMTKAEVLRRRLYISGFEIVEERIAREFGRIYTVMLVKYTGIKQETDELFCRIGKITDPEMLNIIAQKLLKNAAGMEKSDSSSAIAQKYRKMAEIIYKKAEALS